MSDKIKINFKQVNQAMKSLKGDGKAKKFFANSLAMTVDPYVPARSGTLHSTVTIGVHGEKLVYNTPYAHYQYMGIVYEDPKYLVGGFEVSEGEWVSRRGVTKQPRPHDRGNRKRNLQYNTHLHPKATSHWVAKAYIENKQKLISELSDFVIKESKK